MRSSAATDTRMNSRLGTMHALVSESAGLHCSWTLGIARLPMLQCPKWVSILGTARIAVFVFGLRTGRVTGVRLSPVRALLRKRFPAD